MAMLHIVNKSPFERNTLSSCLRLARDDETVLLIEDAVIAADRRTRFKDLIQGAQKRLNFCVLTPDADARGVGKYLINGIKPVTYDEFVDLVASHNNVQSWL